VRELTPREIVSELDRYIVGQSAAKKAVAIAIRNRWRRQRLAPDMQSEVAPKNILMIGPTGVGKTEIARRLARLTGAPFIKVEATKFTEVGYVGRDVESMIRELVENAVSLVREEERKNVEAEVSRKVSERLVKLLVPTVGAETAESAPSADGGETKGRRERTKEKIRSLLAAGELEERTVELVVEHKAVPMFLSGQGMEQMEFDLQGMFEKIVPKQTSRRHMTVREARKILTDQECDGLINQDKVHHEAIFRAQNLGIIFLDEIDKIVASGSSHGADVSRQGVQRDLLPVVEGTTVNTKYGHVKTDHILFIAAGAFHTCRPADLMPELQGRFPIRVELSDLTKADFIRILTEPKGALTRQYTALMQTEGVELVFTPEAVDALANYAFQVNQSTQNIGARRLYTIMERLVEDLSFEAPDVEQTRVKVDAGYVKKRLDKLSQDEDLSKFIL
jgi:ATP-dependent HslUV protease ATP-binding subunit HslU